MINRILPLILLLACGACQGEEQPVAELETAPLELSVPLDSGSVLLVSDGDTSRLVVEIAETEQQRNVGLMKRTSLGQDAGMIFLFEAEKPATDAFWMFNTLIPLDIAFIGADGRIGSIRQMEPCTFPYADYCPRYASGVPFTSALEVNKGYFAAQGIDVGDEVVLQRE